MFASQYVSKREQARADEEGRSPVTQYSVGGLTRAELDALVKGTASTRALLAEAVQKLDSQQAKASGSAPVKLRKPRARKVA